MTRKILLTGGAGFIGLNLCNALIKKDLKLQFLIISQEKIRIGILKK